MLVTKLETPGETFQSETKDLEDLLEVFRSLYVLLYRTRWLAHTRKCTKRGGPVFWIHENYVCPDCNLVNIADLLLRPCSTYVCFKASIRENFGEGGEGHCCKDVPEGQFCNADRAGAKLKFLGPRGPHGIPLSVRPLVSP